MEPLAAQIDDIERRRAPLTMPATPAGSPAGSPAPPTKSDAFVQSVPRKSGVDALSHLARVSSCPEDDEPATELILDPNGAASGVRIGHVWYEFPTDDDIAEHAASRMRDEWAEKAATHMRNDWMLNAWRMGCYDDMVLVNKLQQSW